MESHCISLVKNIIDLLVSCLSVGSLNVGAIAFSLYGFVKVVGIVVRSFDVWFRKKGAQRFYSWRTTVMLLKWWIASMDYSVTHFN